MKHFLKGIAVIVLIMIVSMAIHVFCNMKGIELNTVVTSTVSAVSAILIYHGLIKNEKISERTKLSIL